MNHINLGGHIMRNVLLTAITAGIVFLSGVAMVNKKTTLKNNKKKYIGQKGQVELEPDGGQEVAATQLEVVKEHSQKAADHEESKVSILKKQLHINKLEKVNKPEKPKLTMKEKLLSLISKLVAYNRMVFKRTWDIKLLKNMQPALANSLNGRDIYLPIGERRFEVIQGGKLVGQAQDKVRQQVFYEHMGQPTKHKKCLHKIREPSEQTRIHRLSEVTIYKGG